MEKIAFVFPGQGSQSVGMLAEMAGSNPLVQKTFFEASQVLGYDLWELVQNDPEQKLNQTEFTQPALLVSSIALWRIWLEKQGALPQMLAGHSLGEYTALVCAEALDFLEAVHIVRMRGRFMQDAMAEGEGAMAAIVGLNDDTVNELCEKARENQILSPANFNAIGQTVVAGDTHAVNRLVDLAQKAGARMAKLLPVSVPSHCALMMPAANRLSKLLAEATIKPPKIAVIHNADVQSHQQPQQIRSALAKQLYNPVRWVETIQYIAQQEVHLAVECGPGKVLAGLNKRISTQMATLPINSPETLDEVLGQVLVKPGSVANLQG